LVSDRRPPADQIRGRLSSENATAQMVRRRNASRMTTAWAPWQGLCRRMKTYGRLTTQYLPMSTLQTTFIAALDLRAIEPKHLSA
jgi:hypothetical protein